MNELLKHLYPTFRDKTVSIAIYKKEKKGFSENCLKREFWKTPLNWMQYVGKLMTFMWDRIMGPRWKLFRSQKHIGRLLT